MGNDLAGLIAQEFHVPPERIDNAASFEDMGLDSLDVVELAMSIQREFGVRISDDELAEAKTFGSTVELIATRSPGTS